MMYEQFYGFNEKPFQMVPNAKYLYFSPKHRNALTHLEYGITEGDGFVLLTGEIGTGKTTLIKKLLSLAKPDLEMAVIFSTNLDEEQLISLVLNEFEIASEYQGKAFALDALYQFLVAKYKQNKRVILIVDEAQNLPVATLEELRMMSNIQSDIHNLIQIALVGQPELKDILKNPALAALTQRIACHYHLGPLNCKETAEYIAFRLQTAGGKPDLFAADAVDLIYRASGGIPRTINILCETALVYGFADEVSLIEHAIVEQVLKDRRSISAPLAADRRKPPPIPNEEKHQTNDLIEHIRQLEEKLNGLRTDISQVVDKRTVELQSQHRPAPQKLAVTPARPMNVLESPPEKTPVPRDPAPKRKKWPAAWYGCLALILLLTVFAVWFLKPIMVDLWHQFQETHSLKIKESILSLDRFIPSAADESSPAGRIIPATYGRPAPLEPSLPEIAPKRAMAALRDENAQPAATSSVKPSATHDAAIPDKSSPASLQETDALSETAEQLRLQLQGYNKIVVRFGDDFNGIQPDMFTTMVALANLLRHSNTRAVIRGFADNSGVYGYENRFGEFRANMVKAFLVGSGVNPQNIVAYGLDPPQLLSANAPEIITSSNKGVEIEVDLASIAER